MTKSQRSGPMSVNRRTLFAGAGTLGAAAAAATFVSRIPSESPGPEAVRPAPANGGGYSLTDHVKRYYKTTLI